jgi:hypothetical protein
MSEHQDAQRSKLLRVLTTTGDPLMTTKPFLFNPPLMDAEHLIPLMVMSLNGNHKEEAEKVTFLSTPTGTAIDQTITAFLLRDVLQAGDIIASAPHVSCGSPPEFQCVVSPTHRVEDLIRTVEEHNAKVLRVEPLRDGRELPTVDLRDLAFKLTNRNWAHRILIIDGAIISGGVNPFEWFAGSHQPQVVYYESPSPFLQSGLGLPMAGLCVTAPDVARRLLLAHRSSGTVRDISDLVALSPRKRAHYLDRMKRRSRNGSRLASAVQSSANSPSEVRAAFPHHWRKLGWQHGGNVVTVQFSNPTLNRREVLARIVESILHECQTRGVPLAQTSVTVEKVKDDDHFLRFSVGEESDADMERLCEAVVATLDQLTN